MNKVKKALSVMLLLVLCVLTVFSFTGCGVIYDALSGIVDAIQGEDGPGQTRDRADALRKDYSETIVECFKTDNAEKLKTILCSKTQDISDIEEQIEDGFAFIEGNITEYTVSPEVHGEGMGVDRGTVTTYDCYGNIYKVKTDEDKWYEINFHMFYITCNADRKGVTQIILCDTQNTNDYSANPECYEDNTYFRIGYGWNENYGYDTSCLAYQTVKAISDGDLAALKETFCKQTLEDSRIEAQMQAAFDFFDGNAVFGEVMERNDTIYDGNHDFREESLTDKVVIENYEEVYVYIEAYTVNIETDTGKIYEMEWAAYLKNEKEPELKGILYLKLIDGENSVIIGVKPND